MSSEFYRDPYSSPKRYGLTLIGEISFSDEPYQFELGVVWHDPAHRVFYYAEDGGCSCPSPFEHVTAVEQLGAPLTLPDLTGRLRGLAHRGYGSPPETPLPVQVSAVLARARDAALGPVSP